MHDADFLDDDEFTGGVFCDDIDGGRAGAVIRADERGVRARTTDGQEFSVPYNDCNLEMGGASGHMLFCRTSDRSLTIFCEDRRFPSALQQSNAGELFEQIEEILATGRQQRWNSRLTVWLLIGVSLLGLIGLWYGLVEGARAAVLAVPFSIDEKIGEAALPAVIEEFGEPLDCPPAQEQLEAVVKRLAEHAAIPDVNFSVTIIDTPAVNAVALPGGPILVFRGLIDSSNSAEELASVIAHEMSHVTLRHQIEGIARAVGVVAAIEIMLGDVGGVVALGAEVLQTATLNNYSQEHETAADLEGARMMHEAGLDPHAMIEMFKNLPGQDLPEALDWLSTHPDSEERVSSVRGLLDELPDQAYSPLDFTLEELQTHISEATQDTGN
jgi:Zn-dependent protease with chaperone function